MNPWLFVFFPMVMAFAAYFAGKKGERAAVATGIVSLAFSLLVCFGPDMTVSAPLLTGLKLTVDGFRRVYIVIICFMWAMTLMLSPEYFRHHHNLNRYYFFNLLTLGATLGVFLAADLYTAFVFFEIMSFTSFTWVIQEETKEATRAAMTYLAVAVIGGLVALMGLFLLQHELGTTELNQLYDLSQACPNKAALYIAGGCILFGFGAKAGMFPLHIWLPKAHPVAPAPASALLSGVLTKSGIWGILAISCNIFRHDPAWGTLILVLGTITMVLGAVLALFSINLKRTLACSSMSQIGFILVGIGMMGLLGEENALAARGSLLHMVNHSLFKLVLFESAGVVYFNLHQLDLNEIRGFGRKKPLLNLAFLLGAAVPPRGGEMAMALANASTVMAMLRRADRVKIGCATGGLAMLCATDREHVWKGASYYPMTDFINLARGVSLMPVVECEKYDVDGYAIDNMNQYPGFENVPYVQAAAAMDEASGELNVFVINGDWAEESEFTLDVRGFEGYEFKEHIAMYNADPNAANSFEKPDSIVPVKVNGTACHGGVLSAVLEKQSWNVLKFSKAAE